MSDNLKQNTETVFVNTTAEEVKKLLKVKMFSTPQGETLLEALNDASAASATRKSYIRSASGKEIVTWDEPRKVVLEKDEPFFAIFRNHTAPGALEIKIGVAKNSDKPVTENNSKELASIFMHIAKPEEVKVLGRHSLANSNAPLIVDRSKVKDHIAAVGEALCMIKHDTRVNEDKLRKVLKNAL